MNRMFSRTLGSFVAATVLALYAGIAQADLVNGDPSTDATWSAAGNSLDNGNYVRGAGNFGYQIYTTGYAIPAASPLITAGWSQGDQVIALGGKIQSTDGVTAGWGSAFTGDAVNTTNLTTSVRIVAKFGTSPTAYTLSTVKPNAGNGLGSNSSGDGGTGAITFSTNVGDLTAAGTLQTFANNERYNNPGSSSISSAFGRVIYTFSGGLLNSWEVYLNTTQLAASLTLGSEVPQIGDRVNITLQRSTNATLFTDAITPALAAVPEASPLLFAGLACCMSAAAYALRRKKD